MATFGWQGIPWANNWEFFGFNFQNNVSTGSFLAPDNGTVTAVVFNCAALSGSGSGMTARGGIWDGSGNLLSGGSSVPLPYIIAQPGPYAWQTSSMSWAMTLGQTMRIGWWRLPSAAAGDNLIGFANGGTTLYGTTAGSTTIGAFSQVATDAKQIGVYIIYTPATPPPAPAPPQQIQNRQVVYELMRRGELPG